MHDLALWHGLLSGADASSLLAELEQLVRIPIAQRLVFFGPLRDVVRHRDPSVRAAAIRALGGGHGHWVLEAIVDALDDREERVRRAAVDALRESAVSEPPRFAHALFHRREDVRTYALEVDPPAMALLTWRFYLLADPAHRELVHTFGFEAPPQGFGAVLDFVASGVLDEATARSLVLGLGWREAANWLYRAQRRSPEEVAHILDGKAAASDRRDRCDQLVALFAAANDPSARSFFRAAAQGLTGTTVELRWRFLASIYVVARRNGALHPAAAEVCAVHHHAFLRSTAFDRATRRASLSVFYDLGHAPIRASDEELAKLLDSDLVRLSEDRVDVWALGGILHLAVSNPFEKAIKAIGIEPLVRSFLADLDSSVAILRVRGDDAKRKVLLDAVLAKDRSVRVRIYALWIGHASAADTTFLTELAPHETMQLLAEIDDTGWTAATDERLALAFVPRLVDGGAPNEVARSFLTTWLSRPSPEASKFRVRLLGALSSYSKLESFVAFAATLRTKHLRALLSTLAHATVVTYGTELALAHALEDHLSPEIRAWVAQRIGAREPARLVETAAVRAVHELDEAERAAIAGAAHHDLAAILAPIEGKTTRGLPRALLSRTDPPRPSIPIGLALLGAHDRPDDVANTFEAYVPSELHPVLEPRAVAVWRGNTGLPLLGHAWLAAFEMHAFAATEDLLKRGSLARGLAGALELPSSILRRALWRAVARSYEIWRYRDRARVLAACDQELLDLLFEQLDAEVCESAALLLGTMFQARADPALAPEVRTRLLAKLPEMSDRARFHVRDIADSTGLPERATGVRERPPPARDVLAQVRRETDLERLETYCTSANEAIVHEAALHLLLREEGRARIAALMARMPPVANAGVLADSVALWSAGPALASIGALLERPELPCVLRFRVALALAQAGDRARFEDACRAACEPSEEDWFRSGDWDRLVAIAPDKSALARRLAGSPHPLAHMRSVTSILDRVAAAARAIDGFELEREDREALRAFLDAGTRRPRGLRYEVARTLLVSGDTHGLPLVALEALQKKPPNDTVLEQASFEEVRAIVDAFLGAAPNDVPEHATVELVLRAKRLSPEEQDEIWERMLIDCKSEKTRARVIHRIDRRSTRPAKLRAIAETFAWGIARGRELTGRVFRFRMIAGQGLGYTRLNENRIYVTPLPILRRERHGREIVEALVLHEIGHHVHHRGPENAAVWAEAQRDGMGGLLNLVADEHLERNLRAGDSSYGDRLKTLAAYAFQHAGREIALVSLFNMLEARTLAVLSSAELGVARHPDRVLVKNGPLLTEMERAGLRFAMFVRALRMGLGRRRGDPLVNTALDLFGPSFRKSSMRELLAICRRLRDLFGDEVSICEHFGGHENIGDDETDRGIHGDGITDGDVQEEVERILKPPSTKSASGGPRRLAINVGPDAEFNRIRDVQKVPEDPVRHREVGRTVSRHARNMRAYFERLGLVYQPARFRLRGRRFDTTRAKAVVTRGDPRMLVARDLVVDSDLFLGVVIDCSGSMAGASMERAHAFGVLLADAARGLAGIDVRFFGFTDRVIWDAGDARHPAVTSLSANGGNNDAAALWHAAEVAKASRRRAKLLVMISDGLPTECSVTALRELVQKLTKRERMCCAQVAVRPIEEVCFPHYVEVTEADLGVAVHRFGKIVAALVLRALAA
jgi:hypothetical protein